MKTYKILVCDDEPDIRQVMKDLLTKEGYEIIEASNGKEVLDIIDESFDLIILDVMMPVLNGIDTCVEIRKQYHIPVLFLTAKTTTYDKYLGLSMGADDYLAKPFSKLELLARVSSLIRRYRVYHDEMVNNNEIHVKDLVINLEFDKVLKNGKEIVLTQKEYSILRLLATHKGEIYNLEKIYELVWQEDYQFTYSQTIMVHIANLRRKIGDNKDTNYIKNIWGKGYTIEKTFE